MKKKNHQRTLVMIGTTDIFLSLKTRAKEQIISLFRTKDYSKPRRVKTAYGGGKKQSEQNKIQNKIRNLFKLKKKMKQLQIA